jgi:hypothetical protein
MDRTCVVDGRPYQENDEMMEKKVLPRDIYGEIKSKIAAKEVINLLVSLWRVAKSRRFK